MSVKVFIDGSSGTTGLRIADRLAQRPEIELLSISAEGRKDVNERAKVINSADLAFLCLPDAASKEVMPLLRPDVKVLEELSLEEFKGYSALFENDVYDAIDLIKCCEGRTSYGGPSEASVRKQIELASAQLGAWEAENA